MSKPIELVDHSIQPMPEISASEEGAISELMASFGSKLKARAEARAREALMDHQPINPDEEASVSLVVSRPKTSTLEKRKIA